MVKGYIVGFNQCAIGQGFVITTLSPPDTMAVFNVPDSLYHFSNDAQSGLYLNRYRDFLFPTSHANSFPISYTYEDVREGERHHGICTLQDLSHYAHTVKREIKIICASK